VGVVTTSPSETKVAAPFGLTPFGLALPSGGEVGTIGVIEDGRVPAGGRDGRVETSIGASGVTVVWVI
jgi:hypothetical protein